MTANLSVLLLMLTEKNVNLYEVCYVLEIINKKLTLMLDLSRVSIYDPLIFLSRRAVIP